MILFEKIHWVVPVGIRWLRVFDIIQISRYSAILLNFHRNNFRVLVYTSRKSGRKVT